jgi:uncharacterized 2Fe-2S/4Fe-4S cluster protein (DUF4445 family)
MKELSVTEADVKQVFIAGAFGNYMDPHSAAGIGMIPHRLADRVAAVGHAAGEGAQIALLNRDAFQTIQTIAKMVGFVELAASEEFQDCFVDELSLPSIQ